MKALLNEVKIPQNKKRIVQVDLENDNGMQITISNYGALIQSIIVPDKNGEPVDIVLGFDSMEDYFSEDYLANYLYLGAIIGRYTNRIKNGQFELDGKTIELSKNSPPHQLHGGFEGFYKKVWDVVSIEEFPNPKVNLSYTSVDGEEGFPGNLTVNASYELNNSNELIFTAEATTDQPTAVNLTQHSYFNLNGDASFVGNHVVEIAASSYLAQDEGYVATGELMPIVGTTFDFNSPKLVKQDWKPSEGFDQSFVLDKPYDEFGKAAMAYSPITGIRLEVFTGEPTVHFYTGKYIKVKNGKKGKNYEPFTGLCFETQHHANAVNIPTFPNTILRPGEVYKHKTIYKLSFD